MSFTDIFIRRPVLASVVSLLILLVGLAAGEWVITTGQLKINPGASIRIDNSQPLTPPDVRPKQ